MKATIDQKSVDKGELLAFLGIEPAPPADQWVVALGTFAAGLVVGAGVALLLAPKSGRALRAELKSHIPH